MKLKVILSISLFLSGMVGLFADSTVSYANVEKSEPIYRTANVRVPYEEVVSTAYTVKVPCGESYEKRDTNTLGLDTIIGAGIGLAIGNQVGGGKGRDVAKAVGGLSGAYIANQHRDSGYTTQYCNETRYKDKVITKYDYVKEDRITGYRNIFTHNGKRYTKISKKPLHRVRITTTISF